ncbi:MAG TPA: HWE histidine kinase domain-containing protein [Pseudolabrys sp.]|jgi:PAS domain S-box-containing protein|nr:HWE histidine kinase domain-containing protein [Pseudolabrys sp.]
MNANAGAAHDMSQAVDSERASRQAENRRLKAQVDAQAWELNLLRARFARYEAALRASRVAVYTQDRDLRYTSISSPFPGRSTEDILGRTDDELLPPEIRAAVIGLKRETLATGAPQRLEIAFQDTTGMRWHDVHVEPLRNEAGEIMGLTCAAVDVTERKEGEAHLRLLLRELTHRSKNLLAVIQAMARQTARHAGSIEPFLEQFSARLQALAASHDLLVRENWHGASVNELVRSQLAMYMDRGGDQVTIEGPAIALKPEAAQNLGLALHELAVNAARFGALSVPDGHVSVTWERDGAGDQALQLDWRERDGPNVKPRRKRGFGSMVIERNLARALDAEVDLTFDPDGLHCHVIIPANQIIAAR